jgi:transcriptional regulator of arginine metabolism
MQYSPDLCINLCPLKNIYAMKNKANRLDTIKMVISSQQVGSQEELLNILKNEGFELTQATLSRDLKQLKVAKASTVAGKYIYVLPNDVMYKRNQSSLTTSEMLMSSGFISIRFSGNLAVIRTKPGYASSMAYDIDTHNYDDILGTIAGDDTILLILKEGVPYTRISKLLSFMSRADEK